LSATWETKGILEDFRKNMCKKGANGRGSMQKYHGFSKIRIISAKTERIR
jgi:hypothetical protein